MKQLPNILTLCNLFSGCLGIIMVSEKQLAWASVCIFTGLIFDFLDGFTARLLKAQSDFGKQLDSLADLTTFGVLPSMMVYSYLSGIFEYPIPYLALLLAIFSAIRLAIFNIDSRQSDQFIGLPTPANALLWACFPLTDLSAYSISLYTYHKEIMLVGVLLMSYLLIAQIPLMALKFKDFSWSKNRLRYLFLILSLILSLILHFLAIPVIIALYILLSIITTPRPEGEW
jgi:CDP-diacylglycerol---serine O-phosphatidyltransferase